MKSGVTVASDFTTSVDRLALGLRSRNAELAVTTRVIYGGAMTTRRGDTEIIPWHAIDRSEWHDMSVTA